MRHIIAVLIIFVSLLVDAESAICSRPVRIGYFANITHAQAIVGKVNGTFEKKSGEKIDWKVFNAGPAAMEALLSGSLDMAYVGPNPALNAYVRSEGKALRIIAGAASGGASLVVQKGSDVRSAADLKGKRVASPEYGNTQDISLRSWLKSKGLKPGRDLQVMPIKNAGVLDLFGQGQISAAWVPEPWVSRLLDEAKGSILLDERSLWPGGEFPTAVLVVRKEFLESNRELVARLLDAHIESTLWINESPQKSEKLINSELARITRKALPEKTMHAAMSRLSITYDPVSSALFALADRAKDLGFLPLSSKTVIHGVLDLSLLNQNLAKRKLPAIK